MGITSNPAILIFTSSSSNTSSRIWCALGIEFSYTLAKAFIPSVLFTKPPPFVSDNSNVSISPSANFRIS